MRNAAVGIGQKSCLAVAWFPFVEPIREVSVKPSDQNGFSASPFSHCPVGVVF